MLMFLFWFLCCWVIVVGVLLWALNRWAHRSPLFGDDTQNLAQRATPAVVDRSPLFNNPMTENDDVH